MNIPHSRPTLDHNEIKAIGKIVNTNHIAQGNEVQKFENIFAQKHHIKNAVAVNSGTSALHLALLALNITQGDEVIIPSFVCTALLNAVNYTGATPIISDVTIENGNISLDDTKCRITLKTKAIIIPHMFGQPVDLKPFLKLGIPIIEDCAQSIGAKDNQKLVGSSGIISIFSFYATKMMTTGEGGMVLSNNTKLMTQIKNLRDYDNQANYKVRYNYKMTDFQASMGIQQFKKLPQFIEIRKSIANQYSHNLNINPQTDLLVDPQLDHIYFRYIIKTKQKNKLIAHFKKNNIHCAAPIFKALHQYLNMKNYPNTEHLMKTCISLPIYPSLKKQDINKIIKTFNAFSQ